MRNIFKILVSLILGGALFACSDKVELESPEQEQIEEVKVKKVKNLKNAKKQKRRNLR